MVSCRGWRRDLDRAYTNFFAGRASYPAFKRRDDRHGGFVVRDIAIAQLNRHWAVVRIPKVGSARFRLTRAWPQAPLAGVEPALSSPQDDALIPYATGVRSVCTRQESNLRWRFPASD